jgi:uncharacterized FlaG/YvyC family protein
MRVMNERRKRHKDKERRGKRSRTRKSIEEVLRELNETMQAMNRRVTFSLTKEGRHNMVSITDTSRGIIIQRIPADELLQTASTADLLGVLIDKDG